MDRLPVEIYGEIISFIRDRRDIITVSLVSREFQREADPFLWRSVTIQNHRRNHLLAHIPTTSRIAVLIQSLDISIRDATIAEALHATLKATINLKSLEIATDDESTIGPPLSLGFLCRDTTFKLQKLSSPLRITPYCASFYQSQTDLLDLYCTLKFELFHNVFTSPSALPALACLFTCHNHVMTALLPGRNVTHLAWISWDAPIGGPFSSVQVLFISLFRAVTTNVWSIFPNLRTIATHRMDKLGVLNIVQKLDRLTYAKILYPRGIDSYQSSAEVATQLYRTNPKLEVIEITYKNEQSHRRWILRRGCSLDAPDPSAWAEPLSSDFSNDAWKSW